MTVDLLRCTTTEAPADLLEQTRVLMDRAFTDFTDDDWAHALGGTHLFGVDDGQVVAHGAVVARPLLVASRPFAVGYLEAVAVAPGSQGNGQGSVLVAQLTDLVRTRFDLGALSTARQSFYERLGWERWNGPTSVLDGGTPVRTPEDDDALMVLRHGPSAGLDLHAEITCQPRPGDDW